MLVRALAVLLPLLAATPALAHGGHAEGFAAGLAHPLLGADHLIAMLAIGIWAAQAGTPRAWALPGGFLAGMAGGIALGLAVEMPGALEHGVAGTLIALGLVVALAVRLPPIVAGVAAAGLGLLHGAVHGAEIAGAAGATAVGMLAASAMLHAVGFGLGRSASAALARFGGAGVAVAGVVLLAM